MPTTRRAVVVVARWSVLVVGVFLTTFSFVHLVDVHAAIALSAPWWWIGLIGVATTLVALGAPRSARRPGRDDGS